LIGQGKFRIAAVKLIAREARVITKVLPAGLAVRANAAGVTKPEHANAITLGEALHTLPPGLDDSNNLMARDKREFRPGKLAVEDMQVRPADAASQDAKQHLARTRRRHGQINLAQRLSRDLKDHGTHGRHNSIYIACAILQ
jgi:hypothetical protein